MSIDIGLFWQEEEQVFDIQFENGDILAEDSVVSSTKVAIFTTTRLQDYEQPDRLLQGGWIGSVFYPNTTFGSKFEDLIIQSNLSQDTVNALKNEIIKATKFLYLDNQIKDLDINGLTMLKNRSVSLDIDITKSSLEKIKVRL